MASKKKVCLQAGHVGLTSGATGAPGEQAFNKAIVDMLAKDLEARGMEVYVTGANAYKDRKVTVTDWDLFLAVHYDADIYNESGGFVDFADPEDDMNTKESQRIAGILSEEYFKTTKIKNFPKRSNANTRDYYMWDYLTSSTPCVLIECGVGNRKPKDYDVLNGNRPIVVEGISRGICKAMGISYGSFYDVKVELLSVKKDLEKVIVHLDEIYKNL